MTICEDELIQSAVHGDQEAFRLLFSKIRFIPQFITVEDEFEEDIG